jgi:hypothetical protein
MAAIIMLTLWCLLLPSVMWLAVRNGGGLEMQWTLLPIFYTIMQVVLFLSYATFDWAKRSRSIREALHLSLLEAKAAATEETALLSSSK